MFADSLELERMIDNSFVTQPKINLVGFTFVDFDEMRNALPDYTVATDLCEVYDGELVPTDDNDASIIAEAAGRICYASWQRPNPATATNEGYLSHIKSVGHLSIAEHNAYVFVLSGVSRSFTHEMVRHRIGGSYSMRSQRYVDDSKSGFVIPEWLRSILIQDSERGYELYARTIESLAGARSLYTDIVGFLEDNGVDRKTARGAARSVLPTNTETQLFVTGNARFWREFIIKRYSPRADPEIRRIASIILDLLVEKDPNIFADLRRL